MAKMTNVTALNLAISFLCDNGYDGTEMVERLSAIRDSLVKRAEKAKAAERKPTKAHIEAEQFVKSVREFAENHAGAEFIVSEVAKEFACTNQRIVSAFTKLVADGVLVKGDGWYEIAGDEDE